MGVKKKGGKTEPSLRPPHLTYHWRALITQAIFTILGPVFDINLAKATDDQLCFALVKHIQKVRGHDFVKAKAQGVHLKRYIVSDGTMVRNSEL